MRSADPVGRMPGSDRDREGQIAVALSEHQALFNQIPEKRLDRRRVETLVPESICDLTKATTLHAIEVDFGADVEVYLR